MVRSRIEVKNPLKGVDLDRLTKDFDSVMKDFILNTLTIFVTHSTDPIPVWSGAARATFKKLAAEARVRIDINPVAPSRISLGEARSTGEVFVDELGFYGWEWSSDLDHISIVDDRVQFIDKGVKSIEKESPNLPTKVELRY